MAEEKRALLFWVALVHTLTATEERGGKEEKRCTGALSFLDRGRTKHVFWQIRQASCRRMNGQGLLVSLGSFRRRVSWKERSHLGGAAFPHFP